MVDDFVKLIEPLARHFFGEPNKRLSHKGELRFGTNGSLSIDLKKGTWFDHETQDGGGALDLVRRQKGFTETRDVMAWLEAEGHAPNGGNGHDKGHSRLGAEIARYDYTDEAGKLLFQVVRYEPKDFRQRRPNGNGGWTWSIKGVQQVPYHLPELSEALANERLVFIVEGEKDADNLWRIGVPATTNAQGAGKWPAEIDPVFAGADVVIIADNDPQQKDKAGKPLFHEDGRPKHAGQDHANAVAAELSAVAARVRVLDLGKIWKDCPPKGDISDWIAAGGDASLLYHWVETLQDWTPQTGKTVALVPLIAPFPINGEAIPPRAWNIPGLLLRRHLSMLVAPPGIGKSLLTLQIGMAAAAAIVWAGWRPRKPQRVLFINSEDDSDEMRRRLYAAREIMKIDPAMLSGLWFAEAPENIVIAKADARTKTVLRTPMVEAIVATMLANAIDILIVDPFAETFEGDENSNSELKWAAALWREIARRTNAAVLLVHHTRKFNAEPGSIDAARGASALIGIARIVSTLFPMTTKEAETMLDDPTKRGNYLRFDDAKANLSLVTIAARWFEKKTITLPNATAELPADEVGALLPWAPKTVWDKLDVLTANKILDEIKLGTTNDHGERTGDPYCLKNSGAKNNRWAGNAVIEHVKCTIDQTKEILAGWIKSGALVEFNAPISTSKGQGRKCLRVDDMKRPGTTTITLGDMNLVAEETRDDEA